MLRKHLHTESSKMLFACSDSHVAVMSQSPLPNMALVILCGCVKAHRHDCVLIAGDGGTLGW